MNAELLDPFAQDYPETLTASYNIGHATCLRFNTSGSHVAVGLVDGTIIIWDTATSGVARVLKAHTRTVQSLCWSHDGRYLLTAARDWKCVLWDLKDGSRIRTVVLGGPIWSADLHPTDHLRFVASVLETDPVLVDLHGTSVKRHPLPTTLPTLSTAEDDAAEVTKTQYTLVAVFDRSGKYIYSGTSRGLFNVIDADTFELVKSSRLCSAAIKHIRFSYQGKTICVNCADRVVRTIPIPQDPSFCTTSHKDRHSYDGSDDDEGDEAEIEVEHKFQDLVNRLQWNACAFSGTGDYFMASTVKAAHEIYIWERAIGSLINILEGPKEELIDVDWHPSQPMVIAAGLDTGTIYQWSTTVTEGWSAFAPDFIELDENLVYEEREDEFDIVEEVNKPREEDEDDDMIIDIMTAPRSVAEETYSLPVLMDKEEEETEEYTEVVVNGIVRQIKKK